VKFGFIKSWLLKRAFQKAGRQLEIQFSEGGTMVSWRTTVFGVLVILGALVAVGKAFLDGDPATVPDWGAVWVAILAGIGLIKARDQKSHEEGQ